MCLIAIEFIYILECGAHGAAFIAAAMPRRRAAWPPV